ncbi:MAG: DUF4388 domain-containing protein [Myxococcota bacterium]
MRAEDAVVDIGVMSEEDLLRYLARIYGTRFVGTRKLARASIDPAVFDRLPLKAAEQLAVCPILYDDSSGTLSVVAADLEASDVAKEVQMVSRARQVRVYVAMPAAVQAAIRKHYRGDATAFAELEYPGPVGEGVTVPAVPSVPAVPPPAAPEPLPTLADEPSPSASDRLASGPPVSAGVSWDAYLESLNVMVALLEQGRGELRGHSAQVGRLCRKLGQRLDVSSERLRAIVLAAYLHDVGKASSYHLTAFNVAHYEGHAVQARKSFEAPLRLFDQAGLPEETVRALTHMYERADGGGFPAGLKGKDLPLGARMLAVAESYADLTCNSRNPFRQRLSPQEACEALGEQRDVVLDAAVLDTLRHEVLGDDMRARLLADRRKVLVVDPDAEETTVLEMRLMEHGHEVLIARTTTDAAARLEQGDVDLVISELDVPPDGGFGLMESFGGSGGPPVLLLTRRGDRESVARGFALGAADYLVKPASGEVVVAKTDHLLQKARRQAAPRGVTGSLREMALPDVVQILSNGRKTGRLTIRGGGVCGEVWFGEGEIHDARLGDRQGEEAFYPLLKLTDGDFELDPTVVPERRTIHLPAEGLLLEGMRRLDEGD